MTNLSTLPSCIFSTILTLSLAALTSFACSSEGGAAGGGSSGTGSQTGGTGGQTSDTSTGTGGGEAADGSAGTGGTSTSGEVPKVDPGVGGDPPELGETVRIHVVGDSTAAPFPADDETGRVGWGMTLPDYFDDTITIFNHAKSGRSSKSFYDEGFWGGAKSLIEPGDYVLIQFGHNDEKVEDPTRYTDPATTYRDYLNVYIGESRELGAFPVLLTSISRLKFIGTSINPSHGNYPQAMKDVAEATGTPLIDMEAKTAALFETWGPVDGRNYFATDDTTHTNADGADAVARLVAEGIEEEMFPIAERLSL